jgi:hypothetical protein
MATRTTATDGGGAGEAGPASGGTGTRAADGDDHGGPEPDFLLPVLHVRVPARLVKAGFLGGLAAAVLLDAVDVPVAALLAVGVAVARHRRA